VRLVIWNCCSGFSSDVPPLLALKPTVAVLPESPAAPPLALPLGTPELAWASVGAYGHKSLSVVGIDTAVIARPAVDHTGRWSLAVDLPEYDLGVLAIWATPERLGASNYVAEVVAAVEAHREWICSHRVVVAGDFNADGNGRAERASGAFSVLVGQLSDFGLVSAYHQTTGEAFGQETRPTYFHRRKETDPFHIDFAFVPSTLLPGIAVEVGSYETWVAAGLSDHVPLIIDFALDSKTPGG
jgi:hypothetical protein